MGDALQRWPNFSEDYVIPSPQLNEDQKKKKEEGLRQKLKCYSPKSGEDQKKGLRRSLRLYLAGI